MITRILTLAAAELDGSIRDHERKDCARLVTAFFKMSSTGPSGYVLRGGELPAEGRLLCCVGCSRRLCGCFSALWEQSRVLALTTGSIYTISTLEGVLLAETRKSNGGLGSTYLPGPRPAEPETEVDGE